MTDNIRTELTALLVGKLSNLATGPLSDTPYSRAHHEPDGMLSLFLKSSDALPDASVDIPQLAEALLPLLLKAAVDALEEAAEDIVVSGTGGFNEGADAVYEALRARALTLGTPGN